MPQVSLVLLDLGVATPAASVINVVLFLLIILAHTSRMWSSPRSRNRGETWGTRQRPCSLSVNR